MSKDFGKRYAKGRRTEYRVKSELERQGFFVVRCAVSRPVDLIAFREDQILFVECKRGRNPAFEPNPKVLEIVKRLAKKFPVKYILAKHYPEGWRWKVEYIQIFPEEGKG